MMINRLDLSSPLSDDILLELNYIGLIPGPSETESAFCERVNRLAGSERKEWVEVFSEQFPESQSGKIDLESSEAVAKVNQLFDVCPTWVHAFLGKKGLAPWEGGATWWIEKESLKGRACCVQVKPKGYFFLLPDSNEILAHELVHCGRSAFEEPCFEEILAYQTSSNRFRRFMGPLFQTPAESMLALFVLLTALAAQVIELIFGLLPLFLVQVAYGGAFFYWGYLFVRLLWRQRAMTRCRVVLGDKADPVLYRLTDQEIYRFSKMTFEEVQKQVNSCEDLRWRVIRLAYF